MNTATKLGSYVLGLAVVFGAALGVGKAVGPIGVRPAEDHGAMAAPTESTAHGEHSGGQAQDDTPGGLQVSENGYTLTPLTTTIKPGEPTDFRFTVIGPGGAPVTDYQVRHDKKLHLIVVSRDLAGFQHLHPVEAGDGVWSVKLTVPQAGVYRAFADFAPAGGGPLTLGTDLFAAGPFTPEALPRASRTDSVDGYTVTLDGDLVAGKPGKLMLKVSKDGKPVTDLQPYLGAYGHLVTLRAGDLAYLHVHPDGEPGDGATASGPEIVFYADVPSAGDYRLFLDFRHQGVVRTADFTLSAGQTTATVPQLTSTPPPHGHDEHGH